jgi:16S rRNA G966 N2-methylase RsmD
MDVLRFVSRPRSPFDVALADPPYAFTAWPQLLEAVPARFIVAESSAELDLAEAAVPWERVRSKRYGRTVVTFLEPRSI